MKVTRMWFGIYKVLGTAKSIKIVTKLKDPGHRDFLSII